LLENAYNNPEFCKIKFLEVFHENLNQDVPFNELWNISIDRDYSLKSAEKDILYSLGNSLGKVGCDESVSNLHLAMDRLKSLHSKAIEEYSKNGNLYRWVGILIGIAVSIMVV
jgi:stage III sporulation protein AB